MRHFTQPSFIEGKPDIEQVDCQNQACDYRDVTLSAAEHLNMTPARRAGYLKVGKAQRIWRAQMKAQEDGDLEALFAAHGLNRKEFWGDPSEWHR